MKIIFAGTPDFAAVALKHLIDAGHEIALVLSQPDRPSGRGMKLTPSPVKKLALEHGIPVITPVTLSLKKAPEESARIHADLKAVGADLLVVAAYGLILPQAVLDCAKGIGRNGDIRAINIHGSLLPRWRGAAPVARAIESGDAESGVVLMKMELGLDTGPMIRTVRTPITQEDTSDTLMMRLAELGAELLVESLRTPDELDWTPQPEDGVPVKIWQAEALELSGRPGEVLDTTNGLVIACGEGALRATVLQKPGKPKMAFGPFLQSLPFTVGEVVK